MGKYLIKKDQYYVVFQKHLGFYVAESHYFDAKGKRQLTLTDKEEYAERMTLSEANEFVSMEKNSRDYEILEADDNETEEVDEDEEN